MVIKVLGSGCMNCRTLEKRTKEALQELNIDAVVEKVEDIQKIAAYKIICTPGLVIDEMVVSYGCVPKTKEIKKLISSSMGKT